jgi:cystinosin
MSATTEDALEQSPETPLLGDEDRLEQRGNVHTRASRCQRFGELMVAPLTDDNGSGWGVVVGLLSLTIVGTSLGMLLPQNQDLPTPWYRGLSSAIGYTYFLCWSVSFYPQVISNYTRKSTQGLSTDFCALNVVGFACYAVYNLCFFFSKAIQDMYRERHGGSGITVQSNDVAFAVHALILSSLTWFQIGYFHGISAMVPSRVSGGVIVAILTILCAYIALVVISNKSTWLDFLYFLSYIKLFVSLIKYTPQVILNFQRKSTQGWSIWNILLDFTGGMLSVLQLVFDCSDMGDWTGITGNAAKFGLGNVSIFFDVIFMLQHYVLYRDRIVAAPSSLPYEEEVNGNSDVSSDAIA